MVINSKRQKGVSIEDISISTDGSEVTGEDLAFKEFSLVSGISLGSREPHIPETTTSNEVTDSKDVVPSLKNETAVDGDGDAVLPKRKRRNRNRRKNKNCTQTVTPEVKDHEEVAANEMDPIACQKMGSDNSGDNANEVDNTAHDVTGDCTQTKRRKKKKNRNQRKRAAKKDETPEDVCTSIEETKSTVCEHSEESHLTPFETTEEVCPDSSVREENAQISSPEITTSDGVAQNHDRCRTVMDLMPYNEKFAELQRSAYWRSCWLCKAEGYNFKLCRRCGLVSYCGKDCRRQDRERHKHLCKLVKKFNTAISKVDPEFVKSLHMAGFRKQMSCSLGSIPDLTRYQMLGPRVCVVVEIVKIIPDPVVWKVLVRDITNQTAEISFNTFRNCATLGAASYLVESLLLARVLKPGNFLILLNICWRFYEHKAAQLIVEDLKLVHPIIMSEQKVK